MKQQLRVREGGWVGGWREENNRCDREGKGDRGRGGRHRSQFRSCVRVEVAVLGFPS